ncbi:MAG: ThaI family type II restriction endonuclease [Nitrososphaerales archaeon]
MITHLAKLFEDAKFIEEVKKKLPYLFYLAEVEVSKAGKVGMEAGTLRENILIALLIHKFGEENIETVPITEHGIDVKLFGQPLSIKTIRHGGGVKAIWTVNAEKALEFVEAYKPKCDILLAEVKWEGLGGLYYIPLEAQQEVFECLGKHRYLKLPKPGTNPRGVEFSREALRKLMSHPKTKRIQILWTKPEVKFNPYERWVKLWKKEIPEF